MIRVVRFGMVCAMCLSVVSLAGCLKATGGGKLTGTHHLGATITTGFQMRCEDLAGAGHVTGQFQYHDHTTDIAFDAVIDQYPLTLLDQPVTCEAMDQVFNLDGLQGTFMATGTYTPHPKNLGPGGSVTITIQDQNNTSGFLCGSPGVDALSVQINASDPGVFPGYAEQGCLDKGNFTVFTE